LTIFCFPLMIKDDYKRYRLKFCINKNEKIQPLKEKVIGYRLAREKMAEAETILQDGPMKDTPEVLY